MKTYFTTSILRLVAVVTLFACFAGYSFLRADSWTPPSATPPSGNVEAPVNHGTSTESTQAGSGNLGFDQLTAFARVNSDLYCDGQGNNCTNAADLSAPPPVVTPVESCKICLQCKPGGGAASLGIEVCSDVNAGWSQDTGDLTSNGSPANDNDSCRIKLTCGTQCTVAITSQITGQAAVTLNETLPQGNQLYLGSVVYLPSESYPVLYFSNLLSKYSHSLSAFNSAGHSTQVGVWSANDYAAHASTISLIKSSTSYITAVSPLLIGPGASTTAQVTSTESPNEVAKITAQVQSCN